MEMVAWMDLFAILIFVWKIENTLYEKHLQFHAAGDINICAGDISSGIGA